METVTITRGWHKVNDKFAMTYDQLKYISSLRNDGNMRGWDFRSSTNAMRSLTMFDASRIINALKAENIVIIE